MVHSYSYVHPSLAYSYVVTLKSGSNPRGGSESRANHSSGSLKQGIRGAQLPRSYRILCSVNTEVPPNARFRVFTSNLKVLKEGANQSGCGGSKPLKDTYHVML